LDNEDLMIWGDHVWGKKTVWGMRQVWWGKDFGRVTCGKEATSKTKALVGWMILNCDLLVARIVRFRIWTSGGLFNSPSRVFGTHKMRGTAGLTKQIAGPSGRAV
jgi:hypothetical protein